METADTTGFVFFVLFLLTALAWVVEYHWRKKEPSVCVVSFSTDGRSYPEYQGFVPFFGSIEQAQEEARRHFLSNGWCSTSFLDEFRHPRLPLKALIVVSLSVRYREQINERDRALRVKDKR